LNCDKCRNGGLTTIRNCAWVKEQPAGERRRAVWARERVLTFQCPKSIITAKSLSFIEQYQVWKELGGINALEIDAKAADALMVLEQAWREEIKDGKV
jgi:hypothetical protein